MPSPRTLFVLADGGRARFVQRVAQTQHFVTFEELTAVDAAPETHRPAGADGPAARDRRHKAAFVGAVAARATHLAARDGFGQVALAAGPRLLGPLREGVAGKLRISQVLGRDLTKVPDADLPQWLGYLAPARSIGPS